MLFLFKKTLWLGCLFSLAFSINVTADSRAELSLERDWLFTKSMVQDKSHFPKQITQWQNVNVPHTFNVQDGADGGSYYRGVGLYQTHFNYQAEANKRTFIEFAGAALRTDVWLNGQAVGRHDGGYTRFRFDITELLNEGENTLQVMVDNSSVDSIAPLGGDFTVYGGLYRSVKLITTDAIHFELLDYAADGVYPSMSQVSATGANMNVVVKVRNDLKENVQVTVQLRLKDAQQQVVHTMQKVIALAPQQSTQSVFETEISSPHLWQGVSDPYLYTLESSLISKQGKSSIVHDVLSQHIGFRDIEIDANKGVLLNGKPYSVHGVNLHLSQRPLKGTAVSEQDEQQDFAILDELGVTGLRLSHYPHPQAVYQHADQKGYLVWSEVPVVSALNATLDYVKNIKQQLREMIWQNMHHPSVFVWGIGNEIYNQNEDAAMVLSALQQLAKQEDPQRPTVYANCCGAVSTTHATHGDLNASNVYLGWYAEQNGDLSSWVDAAHKAIPERPLAISEYGAGGSIYQHESQPKPPATGGNWHPEEYQSLVHEKAWRSLKDKPFLWATFAWVAFDFASDGRAEGDHLGINDKGLVTFDRAVRKDSYYWYQANWSQQPMLHITSKRFSKRSEKFTEVKVYTNQPQLTLTLNGKVVSSQPALEHIVLWENIELNEGDNAIVVSGETANGEVLQDRAFWYLSP